MLKAGCGRFPLYAVDHAGYTPDHQRGSRPIESIERLKSIIDRLRSPGGCPWDLKQTPESLKPFLLEEAHEVAEAIERGELGEPLCEELGDLLMNVFLQARIAEEEGRFELADIADGISDKLIRRHPHVFGDGEAETADEVRKRWDEIKAEEKGQQGPESVLRPLPASLPALSKAMRHGSMAAEVGFDWPDRSGPRDKVREELEELDAALEADDAAAIEHEVGDALLALTSLCRHVDVDPERALAAALRRFQSRFGRIEQELDVNSASLEEMEAAWARAKTEEPRRRGD